MNDIKGCGFMISMIWAFSSMVVLLLIITFLPLGLTNKGKVFLVLTSFLLALGGLAAVVSFPLWKTALMLVVLIFFTAYFLDKKMGSFLYKASYDYKEERTKEIINPYINSKLAKEKEDSSYKLNELDKASVLDIVNENFISAPQEYKQNLDNEDKLLVEDISFLLERTEGNDEGVQIKGVEETETGYLSEIESLLNDGFDESENHSKNELLRELDDLLPLKKVREEDLKELSIFDDLETLMSSETDFFISEKEVAVGKEDTEEKKKVSV
jgi:hypothetical protein